MDALFKADREMAEAVRMVLNSGAHHKGTVSRIVGQGTKMYMKSFSAYCPKALSGIGNLPDTVADRSLHIRLERKMPGQKLERLRERSVGPEVTVLRQRLEDWTKQLSAAVKDAEPELPEQLNDRQQDGAEILLAIADATGGDWPARARQALIELYAGQAGEDQSVNVRLLTDVRIAFNGARDDRLPSSKPVAVLNEMEGSPWGEWHNGKGLTPIALARLLKPFGISPKGIRTEDGTPKGYLCEGFTDVWKRYLPNIPEPFPPPFKRNGATNQWL